MVVDMVAEYAKDVEKSEQTEDQKAAEEIAKKLSTVPNFGHTTNGTFCAPGCCGSEK